MSNEETLQEYNERLEENNTSLNTILTTINNLPSSSGGGESGMTNYSTEEQVIGTWIDGKPLYRKTVVGTATLNKGYSSINHNVSNIGTHRVIKDVEYQSNGNCWGNTYSNATSFISTDSITTSAIGFNCGSAWAGLFIPIVTIEYTKTTD